MTIYEKIDRIRNEHGISRRKLAQLAGIPPSTLQSMMERQRGLTVETISKIATVLEISPEELLNGTPLGAIWGELAALETSEQIKKNGSAEYNPLEHENFSEIQIPMNAHPRLKRSWKRLISAFACLNLDGQEIAAERVEELAQIPKYQRQQDEPAGHDDEEAETK